MSFSEGVPRPKPYRMRLHEATMPPEYVQAYRADEMNEYLDMLRNIASETAPLARSLTDRVDRLVEANLKMRETLERISTDTNYWDATNRARAALGKEDIRHDR